jgi:hypothetical protein
LRWRVWQFEQVGAWDRVDALYREAAVRSDTDALWAQAWRLEDAGDAAGARAM